MGTKRNLLRNGVILATSVLSVSMCFSIGFASWASAGGDVGNLFGNIFADNYTFEPVPVFSISSVSGLQFSKYGFLQDDDSYASTGGTIVAKIVFDASEAANYVNTLKDTSNPNCLIKVVVRGVNSNGDVTSITDDLSITKMEMSCENTPAKFTVSNTNSIQTIANDKTQYYKLFPLTNIDTSSSTVYIKIEYTISCKLSSFETFYNRYSAENAGFFFAYEIEGQQ